MQGTEIFIKAAQPLTIKRIGYLITGYLRSNLTIPESLELEEWLLRSVQNQLLFAELILPYNIKAGAAYEFQENLSS
ncbi:MAG: hypothetical protein WDO19_31265 [Bacteroidota bacterium]